MNQWFRRAAVVRRSLLTYNPGPQANCKAGRRRFEAVKNSQGIVLIPKGMWTTLLLELKGYQFHKYPGSESRRKLICLSVQLVRFLFIRTTMLNISRYSTCYTRLGGLCTSAGKELNKVMGA